MTEQIASVYYHEQATIEEEELEIKDEPIEKSLITSEYLDTNCLDDSIKEELDENIELINYDPVDPKYPPKNKAVSSSKIRKKINLFPCKICSHISTTNLNFLNHMKSHDKKKIYQCILCPFESFIMHLLKLHMHEKHSGEAFDGICAITRFKYKTSLRAVGSKKVPIALPETYKWRCKKCPFGASSREEIELHVTELHKPEICCTRCSFKTIKKEDFRKHVKSHYQEFCCPNDDCDFKASTLPLLNDHLRSNHKAFRCSWRKCNVVCSTRKSLTTHLASHRTLDQNFKIDLPIFKCYKPDCNFKTQIKECYEKHMKTHPSLEKRKVLQCQYAKCFFKTFDPVSLRKHLRLNHAVPLKCSRHKCTFLSCDTQKMTKHIEEHLRHDRIGKKWYSKNKQGILKFVQCFRCDLSIRDEFFENHLKTSHGEEVKNE